MVPAHTHRRDLKSVPSKPFWILLVCLLVCYWYTNSILTLYTTVLSIMPPTPTAENSLLQYPCNAPGCNHWFKNQSGLTQHTHARHPCVSVSLTPLSPPCISVSPAPLSPPHLPLDPLSNPLWMNWIPCHWMPSTLVLANVFFKTIIPF